MLGWKRNLYSLWIAEFVAIAGMAVVIPFLPYYIQALGVTDLHEVELWTGGVFASMGVMMAIFSPIWGSLADRFGHKLMVVRAMFGAALIIGAMGFVSNVQQLLGLHMVLGVLAGTMPAATTLVASTAPPEKTGYAMGMLQTAIFTGATAGPLLGGLVADHYGFREAFLVTAALLLIAGVLVVVFVREGSRRPHHEEDAPSTGIWSGAKAIFRIKPLMVGMGISLLLRFGSQLLRPVLPLFVGSLVPADVRVLSLVGIIVGLTAATSAVAALLLGRAGDRIGHRRILLLSSSALAGLYFPQYFVTNHIQLMVLQAVGGAAMGGALAAVGALLAEMSSDGHLGATYGINASAVSVATAIGAPVGAGVAVVMGLRAPFLIAAVVFGLAAVAIARLLPQPCPGVVALEEPGSAP
jgi:DHA1 family multidrug resistance protein-like MFS transporter